MLTCTRQVGILRRSAAPVKPPSVRGLPSPLYLVELADKTHLEYGKDVVWGEYERQRRETKRRKENAAKEDQKKRKALVRKSQREYARRRPYKQKRINHLLEHNRFAAVSVDEQIGWSSSSSSSFCLSEKDNNFLRELHGLGEGASGGAGHGKQPTTLDARMRDTAAAWKKWRLARPGCAKEQAKKELADVITGQLALLLALPQDSALAHWSEMETTNSRWIAWKRVSLSFIFLLFLFSVRCSIALMHLYFLHLRQRLQQRVREMKGSGSFGEKTQTRLKRGPRP